ncbi:MAG: hypothetical protein M1828_004449 [Chrysothrix sp. TS-e1954]|nr:MAG: hypothetical protein M1828_004449 [Chrysothrix sp. TS-e1954]
MRARKPQLHLPNRPSLQPCRPTNHQRHPIARYATAAAVAPAPSIHASPPPIQRYPATQPPSHKPPEFRKSQLLRQYISLLRSTPLMLFFQHSNVLAREWTSIRRELAEALRRTGDPQPELVSESQTSPLSLKTSPPSDPAAGIRLQIIKTGIFSPALRVVTFYNPSSSTSPEAAQEDPTTPTHALSREAYMSTIHPPRKKSKSALRHARKRNTPLHALLRGPVAILTFPRVTPDRLATALSILAPTAGSKSAFPAPRKRVAPGYYEGDTQAGLQKLMLLGARVEGRTLDQDGVRWVGGLSGGVDGLRGQLVGVLQGVGMSLTGGLEGVGGGLWGVVESRRRMMVEEEGEGKGKGEKEETS